jgi:hypothetical protein
MTERSMLEVLSREFEEYEDIMEESVKDYCSDEDKNYLSDESEASDDFVKMMERARHNTMDIINIAMASLRHHIWLKKTVEIATAALIDAGLVTQVDTTLVIDHNKVRRAQKRVMKEFDAKFEV